MGGDGYVVEVLRRVDRCLWRSAIDDLGEVVEDLNAGFLQLHPHQNRHGAADEATDNCEDEIEGTDILVIGGKKPTAPSSWSGMRNLLFVVTFECVRGQRGLLETLVYRLTIA